MRNCVAAKVTAWAKPEAMKEETLNVVNELTRSHENLLELYQEAREDRNTDAAVRVLEAERRHLELVAKLTGQLNETPQINIVGSAEFITLKQAVIKVLGAHGIHEEEIAKELIQLANE